MSMAVSPLFDFGRIPTVPPFSGSCTIVPGYLGLFTKTPPAVNSPNNLSAASEPPGSTRMPGEVPAYACYEWYPHIFREIGFTRT